MVQTPSKEEIVSLERQYWQAMKNNDVETAVSLTKFPCTLTSPKGVQKVEEDQYRKIMSSAKGDAYNNVEVQNPQVDILTPDTALISYSTRVNGMAMLDVSTWIREEGKWVCAFHSEHPIQ